MKNSARPRLGDIHLPDLRDGDPDDLAAHEKFEELRFDATALDGRDLAGISFSECEFLGVSAHETDLRAATFVDVKVHRLNAPILSAPRSTLRSVIIEGSRIGSAELYEASMRSVHFVGCKLGYLNLRGANLQDVQFTGCSIDELDLGGASVTRLAFDETETRVLDVTRATLADVDLRGLQFRQVNGLDGLKGSTMSSAQVTDLAAMFAAKIGIDIED